MSVFKDFPGLENLEKNSRTFRDFQGPARALCGEMTRITYTDKLNNAPTAHVEMH